MDLSTRPLAKGSKFGGQGPRQNLKRTVYLNESIFAYEDRELVSRNRIGSFSWKVILHYDGLVLFLSALKENDGNHLHFVSIS